MTLLEEIGRDERQQQLLLRTMTDGVPSERDRLLRYSIAELYQELSLFIEESERQKKQLDELRNKT